ncbi:NUDIX domain-containing protein [Sphingomonadaceae bacterium jetA1]|jgi:8-oxo-dGTP pyrophosphatase MutT (NUDIX family)|uniref:NUDIX hydrolase n=1 Tax=Facivitalis istanbulensis TaxID=3075838 RepID=UPI0034813933
MLPEPIPAAGAILMRDAADAGSPPEILMIERGASLTFLGGAMVFPGGRVDPDDHALARIAEDREEAAARIAAIRETIEEVGLAIGLSPSPSPEAIAALRDGLTRGRGFATLLDEAGLRIAVKRLTPFTRWCPEYVPVRRFDARFYLAAIPRDRSEPRIDGGETARAEWMTARDALDRADRGEMRIIFPTRRTLERLTLYPDYPAAVADAEAWPVRRITPFWEDRDGERHLCIPDDLGFPVTAEPASRVERG